MSDLIGKTVTELRPMTDAEMNAEGWEDDAVNGRNTAIVFNNSTVIYASTDSEGNHPGAMFGTTSDGKQFGFTSE